MATVTPARAPATPDSENLPLRTVVGGEVEEVPINVGGDYTPVLHTTASLPKPSGNIPTTFNTTPFADQRATAAEFYSFLTSADPQFLRLNESTKRYTALVNIPRTTLVKVVFCPGMGSSPIGEAASPIDDQFLLLHGDGSEDMGPPAALCLPKVIATPRVVNVMTEVQLKDTLASKGPTYAFPLLTKSHVITDATIIKIAPIPTYFVFDGFEKELDAALVYERLLIHNDVDDAMFRHLKSFLRGCLSTHAAADYKPYVDTKFFATTPVPQARRWAKARFHSCFPSLRAQLPGIAPPPQLTSSPTDIAAILAAVLPRVVTPAKAADEDKLGGMSTHELADTLSMCGQARSASKGDLPQYLQDCMVKNTTDAYRQTIIRKWIATTTYYEDAEVPLTEPLLKMVLKRAWVGKDGNVTRPSLLHAMEGLSPFMMLDLSEDEVAVINDEADLIQRASLVSVQDLRGLKRHMQISVPVAAEEFVLLLKRFGNLIYALFSSSSPLFKCMKEIINALMGYSREARRRMPMATKASILWIVLLQSRQFGLGELNILHEFSTMHEDLRAKRGQITHSEVPADLLANSMAKGPETKRTSGGGGGSSGDGDGNPPKRVKKENPNNWHPKLKAVLAGPLKAAGNPSLTKLMNFCKADARTVIPKVSRVCAANAFLGRCYNGDSCQQRHMLVRDEDVAAVLKLLDPFLKDPLKINKG